MLVSFSRNGRGRGDTRKAASKATGYLLGTHDHKGTEREVAPVLMSGNVESWSQIVSEGNHPGRYTSGSLNFAENGVDDETLEKVMEEFEEALLPGLDPDQYSMLWIKHEDKNRTELHFLVAGEELRTGKRLNTYYHKADMPRIDAWKTAINAEYGFSDPNAPEHKRAFGISKNMPKGKEQIVLKLNEHMTEQVEKGHIQSRKDVIEEIEALGLEVARETKKSISIANPDGGQNIRLKGGIYERDFKASDYTSDRVREAQSSYHATREERAKKARERYKAMYQRRESINKQRYQVSEQKENFSSDFRHHLDTGDGVERRRGGNVVHTKQDVSNEAPRPAPSNSVRTDRDDSEPAGMSAQITNNKKEQENDEIRRRDAQYFEEILRRKRERVEANQTRADSAQQLLRTARKRTENLERRQHKIVRIAKQLTEYVNRLKQKTRKNIGFDYSPS